MPNMCASHPGVRFFTIPSSTGFNHKIDLLRLKRHFITGFIHLRTGSINIRVSIVKVVD